jgi:hypothetical protein
MTNDVPFAHYHHDTKVILAIINEERPQRKPEHDIPDNLWSLWEKCWITESSKRPGMRQVVNEMIVLFPK